MKPGLVWQTYIAEIRKKLEGIPVVLKGVPVERRKLGLRKKGLNKMERSDQNKKDY